MGILGFQKFQTEEVNGGSVKLKMVDKIAEWKSAHPERKPVIVIRFKELLLSVIQLNVKAACFGGCHQYYYQQLDKFFQPFQEIGVQFVLFGGGVKDNEKIRKLCWKNTKDYKRYVQLLKDIDRKNDLKPGPRAEFRERLGLHEEELAVKYGEYRYSTGDLNKDIVQFACQNENVVAILAKDSDFLVYNLGNAQYWSCGIDDLHFNDMTTNAFIQKATMDHMQLTAYQFHIMVALLAVVQDDARKHLPNGKFGSAQKPEATGSIKIIYDICECVKHRVPAAAPSQMIDFKQLATDMFARNVDEYTALVKKQFHKYNVANEGDDVREMVTPAETAPDMPKVDGVAPIDAKINAPDYKQGTSHAAAENLADGQVDICKGPIPKITAMDIDQSVNGLQLDVTAEPKQQSEPNQNTVETSGVSKETPTTQEPPQKDVVSKDSKRETKQPPATIDKAVLQLALVKNKNIFNILNGDVIHVKNNFVEVGRRHNKSAMEFPNLCSMVLRRAIGAVLNSIKHTDLQRKFLFKPSDAEPFKLLGKYLFYPCFDIPELKQLINTEENDDKIVMQMKWKLLLWILHLMENTKLFEKFQKISKNILPTIITVLWLVHEHHITPIEADTIIISDFHSINGSYDGAEVQFPTKINGRTIRTAHLYIHARVLINRCLQICGMDLYKVPVYFNGLYFHNLVDKLNGDGHLFQEEIVRIGELSAFHFLSTN